METKNRHTCAAVIFPGIGYGFWKPLLYWSEKLMREYGMDIYEVPYTGFERDIKGNPEKIRRAFAHALQESEKILKDTDLKRYEHVFFIGKSIGTVAAVRYAEKYDLHVHAVLYTPFPEVYERQIPDCISFTGDKDPWVDCEALLKNVQGKMIVIPEGNHSLETGESVRDTKTVVRVIEETKRYVEEKLCAEH